MLLNAAVHLDKQMSLFALLTVWEVFLSVRDAPTGELRSRLSHFPSTHLSMMQDFPAFFHLDYKSRCTVSGEQLWSVLLLECAKVSTACEAPHMNAEDLQKYKRKQIKSEMSGLHSCNIWTFLFIYWSGRHFSLKWGGMWSKLQTVKGDDTKGCRTQFPNTFSETSARWL